MMFEQPSHGFPRLPLGQISKSGVRSADASLEESNWFSASEVGVARCSFGLPNRRAECGPINLWGASKN